VLRLRIPDSVSPGEKAKIIDRAQKALEEEGIASDVLETEVYLYPYKSFQLRKPLQEIILERTGKKVIDATLKKILEKLNDHGFFEETKNGDRVVNAESVRKFFKGEIQLRILFGEEQGQYLEELFKTLYPYYPSQNNTLTQR